MRIWGAQGYGMGLYVADPDGHVVELKSYRGNCRGLKFGGPTWALDRDLTREAWL